MDAIELFKKAAAAMQTDERYLALDAARRANDENKELQDMIGEFNLALSLIHILVADLRVRRDRVNELVAGILGMAGHKADVIIARHRA